jgi:hypothetical protein
MSDLPPSADHAQSKRTELIVTRCAERASTIACVSTTCPHMAVCGQQQGVNAYKQQHEKQLPALQPINDGEVVCYQMLLPKNTLAHGELPQCSMLDGRLVVASDYDVLKQDAPLYSDLRRITKLAKAAQAGRRVAGQIKRELRGLRRYHALGKLLG